MLAKSYPYLISKYQGMPCNLSMLASAYFGCFYFNDSKNTESLDAQPLTSATKDIFSILNNDILFLTTRDPFMLQKIFKRNIVFTSNSGLFTRNRAQNGHCGYSVDNYTHFDK